MVSLSRALRRFGLTIRPKKTSCSTTTNIRTTTLVGNNLEAKRGAASACLFRLHAFSCQSGDLVALVGRNGAGKTTLMRHLVADPGLRVYGNLQLNGQDLNALTDRFATGILAWLPQQKLPIFDATALQIVLAGRYRHKHFWQGYSPEDTSHCLRLMADCGIGHLANVPMIKLSGGEQQLVWLAQVAAQDAELVLLDEPTQQLDLHNKRLVMDIISGWAKAGKLVLFSTHDLYLLPSYECHLLYLNGVDSLFAPATEEMVKIVSERIERRNDLV